MKYIENSRRLCMGQEYVKGAVLVAAGGNKDLVLKDVRERTAATYMPKAIAYVTHGTQTPYHWCRALDPPVGGGGGGGEPSAGDSSRDSDGGGRSRGRGKAAAAGGAAAPAAAKRAHRGGGGPA